MYFFKAPHLGDSATIYHKLFYIGMTWRIVYGVFRLILGLVLLHFVHTPITTLLFQLMHHEVVEDPQDLLIQTAHPLLQHFSYTVTYFLAFYLIFWGSIEIFLSINLLIRKLWAFPTSIILMGLFVLYEIYRVFNTHSLILVWIILIDIFVIWLIWKEYIRLRKLAEFS